MANACSAWPHDQVQHMVIWPFSLIRCRKCYMIYLATQLLHGRGDHVHALANAPALELACILHAGASHVCIHEGPEVCRLQVLYQATAAKSITSSWDQACWHSLSGINKAMAI